MGTRQVQENRWKPGRGVEGTDTEKGGAAGRREAAGAQREGGRSGPGKQSRNGRARWGRTFARDARRRRGGGALTWPHVTRRGAARPRARGHAPSRAALADPADPGGGSPGAGGGRRAPARGDAAAAAAAAACRPAGRQSCRRRTPPCPSRRPGSPCRSGPTSCEPTLAPSSAWRS